MSEDLTLTDHTGLVVVDLQNDFADPAGGLYVSGGEHVVDACNELIDATVAVGGSVVYTRDWHPPTTTHFAQFGGLWPVHCVAGTWGSELHPRLHIAGPLLHKGVNGEDGYSGFTMRDERTGHDVPTGLEKLLRDAGATELVIVGLAGDVCVKATALDAHWLGWPTTVAWDATACVNIQPGDGERAVDELRAAGVRVVGAP